MAVDILGRVVEAASGKRLALLLDERLFKPLKMVDSSFWLPASKMSRLVQPLPVDPTSGQKISVLDVSAEPKNDSGGAGALSTATDYLRFGQMLLNGGEIDGVRVLSRSTIKLMASDTSARASQRRSSRVSFCWERPVIHSALALPCARAMG
jgi:CubicO group peptidase (beta-lactamase class C family)